MADSTDHADDTDQGETVIDELNRSVLDAVERNVDLQGRLLESWFDAVDHSFEDSQEHVSEGLEGYVRAYEAWMDAAAEQYDRMDDVLEGEEVPIEDFRDLWLNTANEAFKEIMRTSAFAAATGDAVKELRSIQRDLDESAEDTLRGLGFATGRDVREIGERIVELERRQQNLSEKLDEIHAALDQR